MPSRAKLYSYHVKNLRAISVAIDNIATLAKQSISRRDPHSHLQTQTRLYSFLLGAWAECRLKKLLYERDGFDSPNQALILAEKTQQDQWLKTIEVAFRIHHGLTKADISAANIGVTSYARFEALTATVNSDLKTIIEIRNKLAHGQWIYPFNDSGTNVESAKYQAINNENFLSLQFKYQLVTHLAAAIHDLVVSRITFERDFEVHFRKLQQTRKNIKNRKYSLYAQTLVDSRLRGRPS